eukprot:4227396-Amphidinium_carterae.1
MGHLHNELLVEASILSGDVHGARVRDNWASKAWPSRNFSKNLVHVYAVGTAVLRRGIIASLELHPGASSCAKLVNNSFYELPSMEHKAQSHIVLHFGPPQKSAWGMSCVKEEPSANPRFCSAHGPAVVQSSCSACPAAYSPDQRFKFKSKRGF